MKATILYVCVACCFLSATGFAQEESKAIEQEIIEEVWKPFKVAYEARNKEAFKSIHTDDMLRITGEAILSAAEYKANIDSWKAMPEGSEITIDFALESSKVKEDVAYQVGYYRVLFKEKDREPQNYFGQFHVVLRKTADVWKIAQDFDTSSINGVRVDASFFDKAQLLDLTH